MSEQTTGERRGLMAWLLGDKKGTSVNKTSNNNPNRSLRSQESAPISVPDGAPIGESPGAMTQIKRIQSDPSVTKRFRDDGEIARGGAGSVRRVYDRTLRRHIAMKVLEPGYAKDPSNVRRFIDESQITAQLDHPNIVPVYDFGADEVGVQYLTMKLVQGRTLTSIMRSPEMIFGANETYFRLLQILLKVCDAIAFAHSRGVVHRDLKPDNIMVGRYGQVYLMDWGIARLLGRAEPHDGEISTPVDVHFDKNYASMDEAGSIIGTLNYMAPEQANSQLDAIDERTDVFALGAILYEILTLCPPVTGRTPIETILRAQQAIIPQPQDLVGDVILPPGLCKIAMKAMSKEKADRYKNASELAAALEQWMRGGDRFTTTVFPAGTILMHEDDIGKEAFVINKGRVQVFKTKDGQRRGLATLGAGSVVGEAAVLSSKPRTASVIAIEDVVATVITRDALEQELGAESWMGSLVKALAERFHSVDSKLDETRASMEKEQAVNYVLQYLLLYGERVSSLRSEAPWDFLLKNLSQRFGKSEADMYLLIGNSGVFGIDPDRDRIWMRRPEEQ